MHVAEVHIWNYFVGAVAWDENRQIATFEYDPQFKQLGWDLSPIKMPINSSKSLFEFPELKKIRDSI
jgi:serine/threonine-protein kinase HipA